MISLAFTTGLRMGKRAASMGTPYRVSDLFVQMRTFARDGLQELRAGWTVSGKCPNAPPLKFVP